MRPRTNEEIGREEERAAATLVGSMPKVPEGVPYVELLRAAETVGLLLEDVLFSAPTCRLVRTKDGAQAFGGALSLSTPDFIDAIARVVSEPSMHASVLEWVLDGIPTNPCLFVGLVARVACDGGGFSVSFDRDSGEPAYFHET